MVIKPHTDMQVFIDLVENNPDKHFDFNAAGAVIEAPPKRIHSYIQALLARLLPILDGYQILTECAHLLGDWPCRPDVSIDAKGDEPIPTTAPLLAVEIKSDRNTYKDQREKARKYIAHGTAMVWLIFPEKRLVEIYQPNADDQILTEDNTIDGGNVLPGFTLAVKTIFESI
jgi:Uma2 family endonuclease